MAAPTFDINDVDSSFGSSGGSFARPTHQAYVSGDLMIMAFFQDDDDTITRPTTGPNSETLIVDFEDEIGINGPKLIVQAWVGTGTVSAGYQDFTNWNEGWIGQTILIPSGEFDSTTPIDSVSLVGGATSGTTAPSPAWDGTAAGGRVIVFAGADFRAFTGGVPSGWTQVVEQFESDAAVGCSVSYRTAETTASEAIATANWTLDDSGANTSFGLVVNAPAGGGSIIPQIMHHRRMMQ